jgi:alpha-beta hydrolase superfamily lysophospholipase
MSNLHSTIPICRGVADSLAAPRCMGQNPNMAALMNDLWRAALLAALGSLALATPRARADEWPKTPSQALILERSDRMPPPSLYDTPSPLPPGGAPRGGWPVIAWGHGTSGVARICGPSEMKDVYYGAELLPFLRAGFALIAADYAGLGSDVPHAFSSLNGEANDIINAVRAAHAAVGGLSPRWVVDGHSQGGGAAWFLAQREARIGDPGFLGAVSVAGVINLPWILRYMSVDRAGSYYALYHAYGIHAEYPQFNPADMLSKTALAQYGALTRRGCWYLGNATAASGRLGRAVLRPGWMKNPWVRQFVAQNRTLVRRPIRPLLLIAGGADESVPPQSIQPVMERACRRGYPLEFRVFPGLDHSAAMRETISYQLRWIRARFDQRPARGNCAKWTAH